MIRNYFKMKKAEWKVKAQIYGAVATFFDNQKEVVDLINNIYVSLKDVSVDEMKDAIAGKVAEIAANRNENEQ